LRLKVLIEVAEDYSTYSKKNTLVVADENDTYLNETYLDTFENNPKREKVKWFMEYQILPTKSKDSKSSWDWRWLLSIINREHTLMMGEALCLNLSLTG